MYDNINELLQDLGLAEREARYWHENYNTLQESIVHCEDCKWWDDSVNFPSCRRVHISMDANDYCSRGEKIHGGAR